jgi:hypothetical protein
MPKRSSKMDVNQLAADILKFATESGVGRDAKNPAAVALGRMGGLKGGKARAESLSAQERARIAKKAAKARWKHR